MRLPRSLMRPERAAELQPKGGFSNHMAVVAQVFS